MEKWLRTHLHMVSTSMPENPKALSPSTHTMRRPLSPLFFSRVAAAIANPRPTPIVPNVPASNLTGYEETQNNDCTASWRRQPQTSLIKCRLAYVFSLVCIFVRVWHVAFGFSAQLVKEGALRRARPRGDGLACVEAGSCTT